MRCGSAPHIIGILLKTGGPLNCCTCDDGIQHMGKLAFRCVGCGLAVHADCALTFAEAQAANRQIARDQQESGHRLPRSN